MLKIVLSLIIFQLAFFECRSKSVIIPAAVDKQNDPIGVIFFGNDKIAPSLYYTTFIEVHKKLDSRLWIAIVDWSSETSSANQLVEESLKLLTGAGMMMNTTTPFYFIGHSNGGGIIQDYIINTPPQAQIPVNVSGLILANSYIKRENMLSIPKNLNILTIAGELDGLVRISRIAEAEYFNNDISQKSEFNRMTLLIEGMNHFQFCGNDQLSPELEVNDFQPEITNSVAREQIALVLSSFIRIHSYHMTTQNDITLIQSYKTYTSLMLNPIIQAYHMESSERLFRPCNTLVNKTDFCTVGCQWSGYAQKVMGGKEVNMISSDTFHAVPHQKNPIEFPAIHNNCANQAECHLNVTTVSQFLYDTDENGPNAALEIRTKLMSRQSVLLAATGKTYNWTETDGSGYRCAEINDYTIEWAIDQAPNKTRDRYLNYGRILRTGKDKGPLNIGPLWIYTPLEYVSVNEYNQNFTNLISATLNTPVDFWLKSAAAFHYCKVLSPARALEWIYFDSLKGQAL